MLKIENAQVVGWEHAIRGMRNPMNSWDKSDSYRSDSCGRIGCEDCEYWDDGCTDTSPFPYVLGLNDHKLMTDLRNAGTDHRKYLRMITVYLDITAPLYWWKEYDTYKVGTVANSCSTMHKIDAKEFTLDDFSCEHLLDSYFGEESEANIDVGDGEYTPVAVLDLIVDALNLYRLKFLETKDKKYWWQMIQLLPSSYNQRRTVMLNYEVLANMYKSRRNHKLDEWHTFCDWIESLPYSELITGKVKENGM